MTESVSEILKRLLERARKLQRRSPAESDDADDTAETGSSPTPTTAPAPSGR
jgi:hypothetical protein